MLVDAAVEVAQRAVRHARRGLMVLRQLGRAAGDAVELPQVERAQGFAAERIDAGGSRQLVAVAAIEDEHIHAPDADPERVALDERRHAGDEPRTHASARSVNHAVSRPASSPSGCDSVTTAKRARTSSTSPARAGGGSRLASARACEAMAETMAIAASRQRPTC